MGDIEIRGGAKAAEIGRAFEKAAVRGLRSELQIGLNRGTKPMRRAAKESAIRNLPSSGGLNEIVARSRMTTKAIGGAAAAVRITASGIEQLELIDGKGVVVHPVHGHRPRVKQAIPKAQGWFTDAMENSAPAVRRELADAIDTVARQIEAAGG